MQRMDTIPKVNLPIKHLERKNLTAIIIIPTKKIMELNWKLK